MDLSKKLKRFTRLKKSTYIIYGNNKAHDLYNQSLETLLESNCFDFDVRELSKRKSSINLLENAFALGGYIIVDQDIYSKLHLNQCKKLKKIILDPRREKRLKG